MRNAGRWIALAGLLLAAGLVLHDGIGSIVRLVASAGWGLVLAALVHVVPMAINARAWQGLFVPGRRPGLGRMTVATWVRESVNGLLPVARIGGELAAYRQLTGYGLRPVPVVATLSVDVVVSLLSQGVFCLGGVAVLVQARWAPGSVWQFWLGSIVLVALGGVLAILQRSGLAEKLVRLADRLATGRFAGMAAQSARLDRATRAIYGRRRRVVACFFWQLAGWTAGAAEVWAALYFLGHPLTLAGAAAIEAVIQAISSVAFLIPGALGVQEGGFLLVGAALGLDGPTALALAAARRLRDVVVFFPGLLIWQHAETRRVAAAPPGPAQPLAQQEGP